MIIGVFSNNESKEFDSLQNAFNAGAEFSCSITTIDINESYYNRKYTIDFYNKESTPFSLRQGNWKMLNKRYEIKVHWGRNSRNFSLKVIDPLGEINSIEIHKIDAVEIIKEVNNKLKELSSFNSWNEYFLTKEIKELKEEIFRLKDNK